MKLPLRFKLSLVCLIGLFILSAGAIGLFSSAWVDLSRAYGLLSINRRLESLEVKGTEGGAKLEKGEWGVRYVAGPDGKPHAEWLQSPEGLAPNQLEWVAQKVLDSITGTRLESGSFEINLDPGNPDRNYFVAFRGTPGAQAAVATRAHRSLWDLSPWAAPFLGFLFIAIGITTGLIFVLTGRLARAYALLSKAMRDVGAGRYENLQLPTDERDSSVEELTTSLRDMVVLLDAKEKRIAEVTQLSEEDPMTGLKNYRAFTNYMNRLWENAKVRGETYPVLGIVDLDFFKKINDNYGHQVGDFVLRHVSGLIKKSIRMEPAPGRLPDFCGRYGGEEFVVIFSECQDRSAHMGALRLMQAIKAQKLLVPAEINEKGAPAELAISASVGIAAWDPMRFASKEEWIGEADAALYEAKRRGRARLVRSHPELQEWV